MLKTIKSLILASFVAVVAIPVAGTALVSAQGGGTEGQKFLCATGAEDKDFIPQATGQGKAAGAACNTVDASANDRFNALISNVINIFSLVVGVVAIIMIIIGGFRYITSGGDSGNVTGAKNTILYAIIGLVIVALAQFIVRFVIGKAGSIEG